MLAKRKKNHAKKGRAAKQQPSPPFSPSRPALPRLFCCYPTHAGYRQAIGRRAMLMVSFCLLLCSPPRPFPFPCPD